ncbi:class D sortase [uncultured Thermanaerothrix sp.]|uniref:sortase n=1 Tax=uncultured Thermanaerothrix sp. TaxID=1195149 RepID=UPI002614C78E|nr:class D sortase [uncultured Thermanaerothrix sp.]
MARRRSAEDLSVEELRLLLIEKQRARRQRRLAHYRRSGRLMLIEDQPMAVPLEDLPSRPLADEERRSVGKSPRRSWLDRLLLTIEIVAVLGLAFVLLNGFTLIRDLNREVVSLINQPTATPTPAITAIVLPGGHTPPNAPGGPRPNEAEIPEHLRPVMLALPDFPTPTPSLEQAIRIQIPAIHVDAPVVQGDGWEQLKKGVGQRLGTPNPGQRGNIVLSAHNDIFGEIFRDLDKLKPGDQVILYSNQRAYVYIVQQTQIVEPTRVEVMAPTQEPIVTLISCYPYMIDNQRIVVTARLQE